MATSPWPPSISDNARQWPGMSIFFPSCQTPFVPGFTYARLHPYQTPFVPDITHPCGHIRNEVTKNRPPFARVLFCNLVSYTPTGLGVKITSIPIKNPTQNPNFQSITTKTNRNHVEIQLIPTRLAQIKTQPTLPSIKPTPSSAQPIQKDQKMAPNRGIGAISIHTLLDLQTLWGLMSIYSAIWPA